MLCSRVATAAPTQAIVVLETFPKEFPYPPKGRVVDAVVELKVLNCGGRVVDAVPPNPKKAAVVSPTPTMPERMLCHI